MTADTSKLPPFDDVFSEYRTHGISNWKDLPNLGRLNLQELLRGLRSSEKSLTKAIKGRYESREMFLGKSGDDFKQMAAQHENPEVEMGKHPGSWSGETEPVDAASLARKGNATTFNICGWCQHGAGGSCRYSYYISTSCGLLPSKYAFPEKEAEDIETEEWQARVQQIETPDALPISGDYVTTTPCALQALTETQCAKVAEWWLDQADKLQAERERVRVAIKHVRRLAHATDVDKPYTVALRPSAWFNVGDEILFNLQGFAGKDADYAMLVEDAWAKGLVIPGYRHHDGCLSCAFELPVHTGKNLEGRGGSAGASSYNVVKQWEFDYLKEAVVKDPEFVKIWIRAVVEDLGERRADQFDAERFVEALTDGTIARGGGAIA